MRGYRYDKAWLLECIVLRINSPSLYEHLRAHKILILPNRFCLQKYIKAFKASYGFSRKLLECVKEKASEMNEMNRHGGLVIDEMKLSTHLDLKSSMDIEAEACKPAEACKKWDMGGLLYPSVRLYSLIKTLEDRLTRAFSTTHLHTKVVKDFLRLAANVPQIGCSEHSAFLTTSVVRFYSITRVHFLLKGLNQHAVQNKAKKVKPCVM
ncbi:uncharacterized protein LOC142803791 [Rhipicephalus microplus]|uniref:uncharacterized protein LOC142803791 n=1 Tax=Rhipicephalus microplus TaxID=6941 RepID=UPI003F6BC4DD